MLLEKFESMELCQIPVLMNEFLIITIIIYFASQHHPCFLDLCINTSLRLKHNGQFHCFCSFNENYLNEFSFGQQFKGQIE